MPKPPDKQNDESPSQFAIADLHEELESFRVNLASDIQDIVQSTFRQVVAEELKGANLGFNFAELGLASGLASTVETTTVTTIEKSRSPSRQVSPVDLVLDSPEQARQPPVNKPQGRFSVMTQLEHDADVQMMDSADVLEQEAESKAAAELTRARSRIVKNRAASAAGDIKLFGDVKKTMKMLEAGDEYNVTDYYRKTGWSQRLARSEFFGNWTLFMISCNGVYLGVDADHNDAVKLMDADLQFQVCEHVFCAFFTFELLVRFFAFESKRNVWKDSWIKFDAMLVITMVFETWILPIMWIISSVDAGSVPIGPLRLLRLARLARMGRILRTLPELVTMVKGMLVATRAVGSAMFLLVVLIYVFAIFILTLTKENPNLHSSWGTVALSMMTLFVTGPMGDGIWGSVQTLIVEEETAALITFILFITIAAVTVMNMLIGVLVEVVGQVAEAEKEFTAKRQLKHTLLSILAKVDVDFDGLLSKEEIEKLVTDPEALQVLKSLDVDVDYFTAMNQMLFEHTSQVPIPQVIDLILEFRGQEKAHIRDIIGCHDYTRWVLQQELAGLGAKIAKMEYLMSSSVKKRMMGSTLARSQSGVTSKGDEEVAVI